jgi:hypothetical protein
LVSEVLAVCREKELLARGTGLAVEGTWQGKFKAATLILSWIFFLVVSAKC